MFFSQGNIIDLPKDEDTPEKRVDKIFKQMDKVSEETVALLCEKKIFEWDEAS